MSWYERLKSLRAGFWKWFKSSLRRVAAPVAIGIIFAALIIFVGDTIPSDLSSDLTLQILNALLTSGTVFLPLAGVVLTFVLNSASTRIESLRRDRLAVWIAQQEAYVKAIIENKPDSLGGVVHQFGPTIDEYDAKIVSLQKELRTLGLMCVYVFGAVLLQILLTLRAMAEVSPQRAFPHIWVEGSIFLLLMALYGLSILVYWTAEIGRGTESE